MDLTGKLDPLTIEVLGLVTERAGKLNIPFMVVGATARDIMLEHTHGIPTGRATKDLDIAIMIDSWEQYDDLKTGLISTGKFKADNKITHKIHFGVLPIDIIPFGSIEEKDSTISWPPDYQQIMSVVGFQETYENMIEVKIGSDLSIRVASPASIVVLKIFAWRDKKRDKDIKDFMIILKNYLDIGNYDRMHSKHADLVGGNFNYVIAGARLLGRDISTALNSKAKKSFINILEIELDETGQCNLLAIMTSHNNQPENPFEENITLLKALKQGIDD